MGSHWGAVSGSRQRPHSQGLLGDHTDAGPQRPSVRSPGECLVWTGRSSSVTVTRPWGALGCLGALSLCHSWLGFLSAGFVRGRPAGRLRGWVGSGQRWLWSRGCAHRRQPGVLAPSERPSGEAPRPQGSPAGSVSPITAPRGRRAGVGWQSVAGGDGKSHPVSTPPSMACTPQPAEVAFGPALEPSTVLLAHRPQPRVAQRPLLVHRVGGPADLCARGGGERGGGAGRPRQQAPSVPSALALLQHGGHFPVPAGRADEPPGAGPGGRGGGHRGELWSELPCAVVLWPECSGQSVPRNDPGPTTGWQGSGCGKASAKAGAQKVTSGGPVVLMKGHWVVAAITMC